MTMNIFNYHAETGEYHGSHSARVDPKEDDRYLIPANSTTVAPPSAVIGKARVWSNGGWQYVADHRGEVWWADHSKSMTINVLGDPGTFDPPLFADQPDLSLSEAKIQYARRIDFDAEEYRLKFITPGDGMAMTYREKFEQAKAADMAGMAAVACGQPGGAHPHVCGACVGARGV